MPTVPQALRTTRIPVYVSDTSDPISEGRRLGGESRRRCSAGCSARRSRRGPAGSCSIPRQYSHDPGTRLTGQLQRFGLDPDAMEVVVVYDAAIARGTDGGVATNRFEARVPVAEATPAAVAPALNQAANQVADQVAAWVG